jgi:hypothetical protein
MMFSEIIGQKNLAVSTECRVFLVKFFQIGGKTHQTSLLSAVPQAKGMAQFVDAQFDKSLEDHRQRGIGAVCITPGAELGDDCGLAV